jgi:hypothetical protein
MQEDGGEFVTGRLSIKGALKRTVAYHLYCNVRALRKVREWKAGGGTEPPPQRFKQQVVKEYARRFRIHTLIETGTYLGDMVAACHKSFDTIVSVEVDPELCRAARGRFREFGHISIVQGDSADVLPGLVGALKDPCLFWLDGHYSEGITARGSSDTPVRQELECILDSPVAGHVALIDDARCFTGENDYPTLAEVRQMVTAKHPDLICEVKEDMIRIHEGRALAT